LYHLLGLKLHTTLRQLYQQCDSSYGFSVIVTVTVNIFFSYSKSYTYSYWNDRKSQSWPAATKNPQTVKKSNAPIITS